MDKMQSTRLVGARAIKDYTGRGWETLLRWQRQQGFPMVQIDQDGPWESDTILIDRWFRGEIKRQVVAK